MFGLEPEEDDNRPVVAVIRLEGSIEAAPDFRFRDPDINWHTVGDEFVKAFDEPNLRAVCIEISASEGSLVQSNLLLKRVKQLKEALKKKRPKTESPVEIIAVIEEIATGAGYSLCCMADTILADENSMVGGIGVMIESMGFDKVSRNNRLHDF